jgi:small subunit ribosomal protein S3e
MSAPVAAKHNISKKRKFVADGVFYAELREFLSKELAEDGFSGVEVRKTPIRTEIIIRATRTMEVLGPNGRRIRELTSLVQKRFGFTEGTVRCLSSSFLPPRHPPIVIRDATTHLVHSPG